MKSDRFFVNSILILVLSAGQPGQGGWIGGQPGQGNSQVSYGYAGVSADGVPYGGYGGNGGYYVNQTDDQGRHQFHSGGHIGYSAANAFSYDNSNTNSHHQMNPSSSACATAWSTFYVICLCSLFLIIKA